METYHFVTNWYFKAPVESVWEELADVKSWPSWRKVKFHRSESKVQLGT
jgi:hypothetical protein